jgi:hypothetical protein
MPGPARVSGSHRNVVGGQGPVNFSEPKTTSSGIAGGFIHVLRFSKTDTQTIAADTLGVLVGWTAKEDADGVGQISGGVGRLIVPFAGWYRHDAKVLINNGSDYTQRILQIVKLSPTTDTVVATLEDASDPTTGLGKTLQLNELIYHNKGDRIAIACYSATIPSLIDGSQSWSVSRCRWTVSWYL